MSESERLSKRADTEPLPAGAADSTGQLKECDLVMKGGVTSGVVYPHAILELAKTYRFRSIGGASAGAIAAAFAAAGEYGRQRGDPEAFARFRARVDTLPEILASLFQPSPPFERLMRAALAATGEKRGRLWRIGRALAAPLLAGAAAGAGAFLALTVLPLGFAWSGGALVVWTAGALLAALVGAVAMLVVYLHRIIAQELPRHDYGFCSGLRGEASTTPALTEWIHESLQFIAFGEPGRAEPLTFGDLATVGLDAEAVAAGTKSIELRMMTTNLSLGRPHAIPGFGLKVMFSPTEWRRLFPPAVMSWLDADARCRPTRRAPDLRYAPRDADLPVVVGVRMSLSFPLLFQAVPMYLADVGAAARGELAPRQAPPLRRILFSDGGITSNFPIHFFDALLPSRPTFALSLDELHSANAPLISMPQAASDGAFAPIREFSGVMGFASAILAAAKDWQDEMASVMPGQRQRVVRIRLKGHEGGLNLNMPPELSRALIARGGQAGAQICKSFDFDEHRYRRTIVAYELLQKLTSSFADSWPDYSRWFRGYAAKAKAYRKTIPPEARGSIADHLDGFAKADAAFPDLPVKVKFPRPSGRLRAAPDL